MFVQIICVHMHCQKTPDMDTCFFLSSCNEPLTQAVRVQCDFNIFKLGGLCFDYNIFNSGGLCFDFNFFVIEGVSASI